MKQPLLALITSLVSIAGGAYLFTNALENVREDYSNTYYNHSTGSVTHIQSHRLGVGFDRSGIPSDRPAASSGASSGWGGGGSDTQSGLPAISADASGSASDYLFSPRTAGVQATAPTDAYAAGASYGSSYAYAYTGKSPNRTMTNTPGAGMTGYLALPASGAAASRGGSGNGGSNGSVSGGASSTYAGLRSLSVIHTDGTVFGPFAVGDDIIDPDNDGEDAPPPPPLPVGEGMSILMMLGAGYALWKRLTLR